MDLCDDGVRTVDLIGKDGVIYKNVDISHSAVLQEAVSHDPDCTSIQISHDLDIPSMNIITAFWKENPRKYEFLDLFEVVKNQDFSFETYFKDVPCIELSNIASCANYLGDTLTMDMITYELLKRIHNKSHQEICLLMGHETDKTNPSAEDVEKVRTMFVQHQVKPKVKPKKSKKTKTLKPEI